MSHYTLSYVGTTPVAVADTTAFTDAGYATFLQGGSSTQRLRINEVSVSGEAPSASTVNRMVLAGDSTVAATGLSGNRNAIRAGQTAPATVAVFGNTSTTKPQRSATLYYLLPVLNTFGGIYRYQARQGEEIEVIGNTASLGEVSLSSISGTGLISGHILYEVV